MTMNNDLLVQSFVHEKILSNPKEIAFVLLFQCEAGPDPRMDEEIISAGE